MVKALEVGDDARRNEADNVPNVWNDAKECHEYPNK